MKGKVLGVLQVVRHDFEFDNYRERIGGEIEIGSAVMNVSLLA